jgi:hypothetical protein
MTVTGNFGGDAGGLQAAALRLAEWLSSPREAALVHP